MKRVLTIGIAGIALAGVLVLLVQPFLAQAAVSRLQAFSGTNTVFGSTVTTSSVTVTAGNLIICIGQADVATSMTMTDSKGNAWTRMRTQNVAATFVLEVWWAKATTGGSGYTVTATDNGGGVDSLVICEEWSGQDTGSPSDQTTSATGNSTALSSGASGATTVANEIVMGGGVVSGNVTCTLGGGYTNLTRVNTNFSTLCFESKIVAATGAQTAAITAGTSGTWLMAVGTFKEAAGAAVAAALDDGSDWFAVFD